MIKLKLETPIVDTRGEKIIDPLPQADGKVKRVTRTLRENLLKALGVQYEPGVIATPKEFTWIYNLSNKFNGKEKDVEISDEKAEFLRRLINKNKAVIYRNTAEGLNKQEVDIFLPFEIGQMLVWLGEPE